MNQEPSAQQPPTCPWCPYTGSFKQVLTHMEAAHYRRWCDLVLYPPLADHGPV